MKVLFVHQNFPGQFRHLAPALAQRGHDVAALSVNALPPPPGVRVHRYQAKPPRERTGHPWVADLETKAIRGEGCARAALELKAQGYSPDVIYAHPGWGEALFLREVWPSARQLHLVEFFYSADGLDVGFDPEFGAVDFDARCRIELKNASLLMQLHGMDAGVTPTRFQWSTLPAAYQDRVSVIHEGIDTAIAAPNAAAVLEVPVAGGSLKLTRADEVVTFVARNLEPLRGYHQFMRALPELLALRPRAHVLIVGGDGVSYGPSAKEGGYKARYLAEVADRIDPARVHFLGQIPYARYLALLQISSAHVYLTYPFVLSWSMLEAMSCGCVVVGSRTPPVEEVLEDGVNGRSVDFFSPAMIAQTVAEVLADPKRASAMSASARAGILERYDLRSRCLPRQIALVESMV